jgi:two-component system, NarL family, nitrate/nitrite response regulator NarL
MSISEPIQPKGSAMNVTARFRTVLIERETLIRSVLARLLLLSEDFSLLADFGEVSPARDACIRLQPQLLVIDVDFAPEESVALIDALVKEQPHTRVLALSESNDPFLLHRLYKAQIHGFVRRDESIELLEEAMHEVAEGRTYFPASFIRAQQEFEKNLDEISTVLSNREQEILRHVAEGRTSREIALRLSLSPPSVETYRSDIMRKLDLPNSAALVEFAFRNGISRPAREVAGPGLVRS